MRGNSIPVLPISKKKLHPVVPCSDVFVLFFSFLYFSLFTTKKEIQFSWATLTYLDYPFSMCLGAGGMVFSVLNKIFCLNFFYTVHIFIIYHPLLPVPLNLLTHSISCYFSFPSSLPPSLASCPFSSLSSQYGSVGGIAQYHGLYVIEMMDACLSQFQRMRSTQSRCSQSWCSKPASCLVGGPRVFQCGGSLCNNTNLNHDTLLLSISRY